MYLSHKQLDIGRKAHQREFILYILQRFHIFSQTLIVCSFHCECVNINTNAQK